MPKNVIFQISNFTIWDILKKAPTEHLANRRKEPKSKISAWIKARVNFNLIRSMLLCLRGTRTPSNVDNISEIDVRVIVAESNIK